MDKNAVKNRRWRTLVKNAVKGFIGKNLPLSELQSILSRAPFSVLKKNKKSRILSQMSKLGNERQVGC